jgi:hypothetical protein
VRHWFIPQQTPSVVDEKSRRVQHYQDFGDQRFDHRFAHFARDGGRNLSFLREELSLKLAYDRNPPSQSPVRPSRLGRARP